MLPAGSAATAPRDGGRGGGGRGDGDGGDGGGDKRRTEIKRQRRQEREKHAVVLDELAPKETGRQAVAVRKSAGGRHSVCGRGFSSSRFVSYVRVWVSRPSAVTAIGGRGVREGEGGAGFRCRCFWLHSIVTRCPNRGTGILCSRENSVKLSSRWAGRAYGLGPSPLLSRTVETKAFSGCVLYACLASATCPLKNFAGTVRSCRHQHTNVFINASCCCCAYNTYTHSPRHICESAKYVPIG